MRRCAGWREAKPGVKAAKIDPDDRGADRGVGPAQVPVWLRRVRAMPGVPAVYADAGADAAGPGLLSAGDSDSPVARRRAQGDRGGVGAGDFSAGGVEGLWPGGRAVRFLQVVRARSRGGAGIRSEARPAMEACGIDVYATVRRAGFEIDVVRTMEQCPNYFGLILVD